MARDEHLQFTAEGEESVDNEGTVEESGQNNRPEWSVYLKAAVRRHQQLASLNERLARFLKFASDVGSGDDKRRRHRSFSAGSEDLLPRSRASSRNRTDSQTQGIRKTDSFCQNSFEVEELEAAIEEKTQSFRSSLELYDIRIDSLRRAMNSLNEKNEELMQQNAKLRFSSAEASFELQQLKSENERLKERIRRAVPPTADQQSQQNLINSLQLENRRLKGRLERHKQTLRNGLDDFISRSMESLQNGIPMETNYERILAHDSGDEKESETTRNEQQESPYRRDLLRREYLTQLQEQLQAVNDELEHEKLRSQRKISITQEMSDRLRENLTRKETELQLTNKELEAALGALQSLIQTGDESQKEIDVYRRLVDQEESRLQISGDDNFGVSSCESEASFKPFMDSEETEPKRSSISRLTAQEKSATQSVRPLEIEKHDVRTGKYVTLENKGDEPLDISRWYLVQQCGKNKVTHRFPSPFVIQPKSRVVIWSADVKASHQSPNNYVMSKTVLPWCDSGEVDLITKVYDRLGNQISTRETRVRLRGPLADATNRALQSSTNLLQEIDSYTCSIS